ncbi:MAG: hypothetical protein ACXADW_11475 [Candidatus Hodarchaeales archaeon]|jgi:hypothetical protein
MVQNKSDIFVIDVEDSNIRVYLSKPTHREILELDLHYRKMFAEAVRGGLMTHAEASKKYARNNSWTDDDESEIARLMIELTALEDLLRSKDVDEKAKNEAAVKATALRIKLVKLNRTKTDLFENTAESFAEEQKIHKFIQLCLRTEDGDESYFSDLGHYEKFARDYRDVLSLIYRKAYFYDYNLPEDLTADWEEVKYLNDYKEKQDKKRQEEQAAKTKQEVKVPDKKTKKKKVTNK